MRRVAALLAAVAFVLATTTSDAAETRRVRNDLYVAGIVLTSLSVLSASYGMYSLNHPRRESVPADGGVPSERPQPYVYAFASAGVLAAIGIPMLVVGARSRAAVAVAPTVGGLALVGTF